MWIVIDNNDFFFLCIPGVFWAISIYLEYSVYCIWDGYISRTPLYLYIPTMWSSDYTTQYHQCSHYIYFSSTRACVPEYSTRSPSIYLLCSPFPVAIMVHSSVQHGVRKSATLLFSITLQYIVYFPFISGITRCLIRRFIQEIILPSMVAKITLYSTLMTGVQDYSTPFLILEPDQTPWTISAP